MHIKIHKLNRESTLSLDTFFIEKIENWYRNIDKKSEELIDHFTYFKFDQPAPIFFNWLFKNRDIWNLYVEIFNYNNMILDGTTFEANSNNTGQSQKKNTVSFRSYNFPSGAVSFQDTKFSNPDNDTLEVLFSCVTFKSDVTIKTDSDIKLAFIRCEFAGYVCIEDTKIENIIFDRSDFKRDFYINKSSIKNSLILNESKFNESLKILGSKTNNTVEILHCNVKKDLVLNENIQRIVKIEYSELKSCFVDDATNVIILSYTTFTESSAIMVKRGVCSSNQECVLSFSRVTFTKTIIGYVRSEDLNSSCANIDWSFNDCIFDKSKFTLNLLKKHDKLTLHNITLLDTILVCGDTRKAKHYLTLNVHDIRGNNSTMLFIDIMFLKKFIFHSISLDDLNFNGCDFEDKNLLLRGCFINRIFYLDTTLDTLDLRGGVYKGLFDVSLRCITSLKSVIDLRDTVIENIPTLEALAPSKDTFNFKELFTDISSKIKNILLTKGFHIDLDFVFMFLIMASLVYFFFWDISHSVFAITPIFKVIAHTSKIIILLSGCCLSLYVLGKGIKQCKQVDDELASKYCRLKSLAQDSNDHALALKFTAAEHKAKRYREFGFTATFLDYLIELCCNYGQSIARPVACLVLVNIVAFGYYDDTFRGHETLANEYETSLVIRNAVANLSGSKNLIRQDMISFMNDCSSPDASPYCSDKSVKPFDHSEQLTLDIVAGVQTFLSIFFIFLIGLGLRNRYKI
tara:strand:+ start:1286 stop:3511 length:2226 start_codon:yes stop_codon:yes gene_type:complete